jgi:hypothetical protein
MVMTATTNVLAKLVLKTTNRLEVEATRLRDQCSFYGLTPLHLHEGGSVRRLDKHMVWLGAVEYPTPSGVISKIEVYESFNIFPINTTHFTLYLEHEDIGGSHVLCKLTPFQYPYRLDIALKDIVRFEVTFQGSAGVVPLAVLKAVCDGLTMLRESVLNRLGRLDKFEVEMLKEVGATVPDLLNRWQSVIKFASDSSDVREVLFWAISASAFALCSDAERLWAGCLRRGIRPMAIDSLSGVPAEAGDDFSRTVAIITVRSPVPDRPVLIPVYEAEATPPYILDGIWLSWSDRFGGGGRPSVAIHLGRHINLEIDNPTIVMHPSALKRFIPPETPTTILKGILDALETLYGVVQRRLHKLGMQSLLPSPTEGG